MTKGPFHFVTKKFKFRAIALVLQKNILRTLNRTHTKHSVTSAIDMS